MSSALLLSAAKAVVRKKYAWPGGYALFLVMKDGGCLCPGCVKTEWRNIVHHTLAKLPSSGWMPDAVATTETMEEPEHCDQCGVDLKTL